MKAAEQVSFGGGGLDRQAQRRTGAEALLSQAGTRVLPLWRGRVLVDGASAGRLVALPPDHALLKLAPGQQVFLGSASGTDYFAADLSGWVPDTPPVPDAAPGRSGENQPAPALPDLPSEACFADLRGLIATLSPLDAELAATARGILEWHRSHKFCATCGAASESAEGGWHRHCPACDRRHFPRTDPVVIMLVTRGNSILLGRGKGWPEGFYSLLAGFMEPGETVAAAVRREVLEEAGVNTGAVKMLASQPWPFPASLMIGCHAEASSSEITVDRTELEDATWVSREEALEIFAGTHPWIGPPRKGAIAQFLFKMWLADRID